MVDEERSVGVGVILILYIHATQGYLEAARLRVGS